MTFPVGVELEINGTWTDVSTRARRVPPSIARGRPDEASQVAPTSTTVVFDNSDGFLSPRNPESPWYPHIGRGLPCRLSVEAGNPYLLLSGNAGSGASTPDNAALDITGDLFMAVEFQAGVNLPLPPARYQILNKWLTTGNQRSYLLSIDEFGRLVVLCSTDGTAVAPFGATSEWAVPFRTAGPVAVGVYVDVNVGGTSHSVRFNAVQGSLSDLIAAVTADPTANLLGPVFTGSGTKSIFSSTAPLELGDVTIPQDGPYRGGIRRAQVRSGDHTGTVVANPDFTIQTVGASGFTDSATRVWTLAGDATITDRQIRFVGATSSIALGWPKATSRTGTDGGVAQATFTVTGRLRQLQQGAKPLRSTLYRLVTSTPVDDNVAAYWPLEDGQDSKTSASPIGGVPAGSILGATLASDSSLVASEPLPHVDSDTLFRWRFDVPPTIAANTNWQSTMVVNIPTAPTSGEIQMMVVDSSSIEARTYALQISNSVVRMRIADHTGTEVVNATISSDARMFDTWMLVSLNVTQNGGNIDWDYDLIVLPDGFGFGSNGSLAGSCGRPTRLRGGSTVPASATDGWSFGHFIVTTGVSTGWLAGADTAWVNETAAHRVWRLCREESIPVTIVGDNTMVDFFRGNTELSEEMGPQRTRTLPELLQECADTDHGILYEQRDDTGLAFRTHKSLQNQPAVATLDVNLNGLAPPFEPVLDDQQIRNDVTAKRTEGSTYRVTDPTSIANDGLYDEEVEVNVASDLRLGNQAGWRLHLGTWPELRLPQIATVMSKAGAGVAAKWLDMDLGDRIVASNLMRQYDRDVALLLEGYDETLSLFDWTVDLTGSPAGPWEVGVRNDATFRGVRDTAGSELASSATTTATSLSVATTLGPLWTDDNALDGFDINIGGEQMTVTDISGTTSPQTFTVVRSVNGVVKTHSSAAAVSLWRPTVRAL